MLKSKGGGISKIDAANNINCNQVYSPQVSPKPSAMPVPSVPINDAGQVQMNGQDFDTTRCASPSTNETTARHNDNSSNNNDDGRPHAPVAKLLNQISNNNNNNNSSTTSNTAFPFPNLPPTLFDPHTTSLHHQTLQQTHTAEQSRIRQLTSHESTHYTTISEYTHALARERRHSLSLAIELAHYKFITRYQSCHLHSNLEMSEEARMNLVMKRVEEQVRGMKEERGRVVMELEREEEGRVRGLMERLEREKRERLLLERRVYTDDGEEDDLDLIRLRSRQQTLPSMFGGLVRQDTPPPPIVTTRSNLGSSNDDDDDDDDDVGESSNTMSSAADTMPSPENASINGAFQSVQESNNNGIQEEVEEQDDEDEEEEESFNEDILGGYQHDAEMEEELAKMLKLKEEKKE